jgi:hypothetical protein
MSMSLTSTVSKVRRGAFAVGGGILLAALLGTIAFALTIDDPAPGGVVYACYDTGGKGAGKIKLVNEGTPCPKGQNELSWPIIDEIADLDGTPCSAGGDPGVLEVSFAPSGEGHLVCSKLCTAANDGDTRSCSTTNEFGTCQGVETCDDPAGWGSCDAITPAEESCDGTDDDCDGDVDEGFDTGGACGVGVCTGGVVECDGAGGTQCSTDDLVSSENCENGIDDDCDGATDEQSAETCNDLDDDCDNVIDEGFNLGAACNNGQQGACSATGTIVCSADGSGSVCDAPSVEPGEETCNGIDDDCDGETDEDAAQVGETCDGTGQFSCVDGDLVCVGG